MIKERSERGRAIIDYDPLTFYEDPYPIYRDLREQAPVFQIESRGAWVLSRYADVQAAARDHVTFTSARGTDLFDYSLGPGDFLDLDPPRHDELRRIVRQTFLQNKLTSMHSQIRQAVDELVSTLVEQDDADFARDFAQRLALRVICQLFGVPAADHRLIEAWFDRMVTKPPGEAQVYDEDELEVGLMVLQRRMPGLRLAVAVDEVPLHSGEQFLYGVHRLPVAW